MQAGKLVSRALTLEAEGLTGPAALEQTVVGQGHAPQVTRFAATIEQALRRREARAKALEQPRGAGGRFWREARVRKSEGIVARPAALPIS